MFNVIDIANILDVSDKTVYRYFKKYNSQLREFVTQDEKGNKALNSNGLSKLSKLVDKKIKFSSENTNYQIPGENKLLLEELRKQIQELKDDKKYLREQNKELKENISNLTRLLDQEQQLRLHSIKKLEEPTEENQENNVERSTEKSFFRKFMDKINIK